MAIRKSKINQAVCARISQYFVCQKSKPFERLSTRFTVFSDVIIILDFNCVIAPYHQLPDNDTLYYNYHIDLPKRLPVFRIGSNWFQTVKPVFWKNSLFNRFNTKQSYYRRIEVIILYLTKFKANRSNYSVLHKL